jgi:NitT/TauT family transport system ATP-binding protein
MSGPATNSCKVRISGLRRHFELGKGSIDALAGIDLDVPAGQFLSIVGPSGCGKTTLLRIVAGLETPTSGSVVIEREPGSTRPSNSMVFQQESVFPWMSVRDNAAFGLKARGFANDPEILLMDEPFAALDEQTKLILQAELLRIWEETRKTVLYVTHSIDEAIILSDCILLMSARPGRIKRLIDVASFFPRPRSVEAVKSSPKYGELFGQIWGELRDEVYAAREQAERSA